MNQKAASTLMIIFELLIVIFVIYMAFEIARSYASSETAYKINTANDIELMVNTLVATPGEVQIQYPGNLFRYSFVLSSDSITVFKKGESEARTVTRRFSLPQGYTAFGTVEEKEKLCLYKKEHLITLRECV